MRQKSSEDTCIDSVSIYVNRKLHEGTTQNKLNFVEWYTLIYMVTYYLDINQKP